MLDHACPPHGALPTSSSWAAYMIGTKARKMEVYNPARKELLLQLMAMAPSVDLPAAPAPLKVRASPAPTKAGMSPQTAAARSQVRAELGGEAAGIDWNAFGQYSVGSRRLCRSVWSIYSRDSLAYGLRWEQFDIVP